MSLQNSSYFAIELTKRLLEVEALRDYDESNLHKVYYYNGKDYIDEKEQYKNTYLIFKKGSTIAIKEFTGLGKVTEIPRIMSIEDFAQFANNNKLELFNYDKRKEEETFRPVHYSKKGVMI